MGFFVLFLWNSINIFPTNKQTKSLNDPWKNKGSLNLKIQSQDDVISSKPRGTLWPSSRFSSCFLPCSVQDCRLRELTRNQHQQCSSRGMQSGLSDPECSGSVEIFTSYLGGPQWSHDDRANLAILGQRGEWSDGLRASCLRNVLQKLLSFRFSILDKFLFLSRMF